MTARLVPAEPDFAHASERDVVHRLRDGLPDDAVIVCGQRFSDREQDREADVIVAWPGVGVAVMEVKGGSVFRRDGRWRQSSGDGVKVVHPVDQARTCKYLLREALRRHPRWPLAEDLRSVHLVALPATTLPPDHDTTDAPRWMVLDRTDLPWVAERVRDALDRARTDGVVPTAEDVELMVDVLEGPSVPQRDLVASLRERESFCDLLTKDQGRMLDLLVDHPRVEIRGGAGSGKTWLALEKARRMTRDGHRVALICYSRGLAEHLRRSVVGFPRRHRPAYVGTFHGMGLGWGVPSGTDDDSRYWEVHLPARMVEVAEALPLAERFDAVIVDEAQDFADSWWPAVLAALRSPDHGHLYVFTDEGQRVFARQGRPAVDLPSFPLGENLRNTRQIAGTFDTLTRTRMTSRGGDGVPARLVVCATEDAVSAADDEVVRLVEEEGWPASAVALLTTHHRHNVQVELQAQGQDAYWASFWDDSEDADVFYGHVLGFKGLERPAVVLALNGFRDDARAREMLYVGLSRARDLLVVCGDVEEVRRVGGESVVRRLHRG
ncbi:NERD domain-containing protein [Pseudokineococcus lusitanus]|uniref:UvrD-like helicase family protein n=1 Tax=Pseudokineococcus lusitanus TaxID=763993 RepID=A0A3N1HTM1_9ACTN|nr:NERD domain-containing protein [Pseudokineococcus lusitanus]ROP45746.1 UvrD-like helicase family protein [Pseudokineococcus lusitanus]